MPDPVVVRPELIAIDPTHPDSSVIQRAADLIRAGRLVAFPTETVYGLGANALDPAAVRRIFAAKGRPPNNPLIVHAADIDAATECVQRWPDAAAALAGRFWPGPLTLVLLKTHTIPDEVTAGSPTVALRVPAHRIAGCLLAAANVPIAAPSANRSALLSPTRAEHVVASLGDAVDLILDGGPTPGGLESTVLDLTVTPPRLLRPGLVTPGEIESLIGPIERGSHAPAAHGTSRVIAEPLRSPGMLERHYAPRAVLETLSAGSAERVAALTRQGCRVGWLTFDAPTEEIASSVRIAIMPRDATAYASQLYAVLHAMDDAGVERIIVEQPPDDEAWLAIRDRLKRAAKN